MRNDQMTEGKSQPIAKETSVELAENMLKCKGESKDNWSAAYPKVVETAQGEVTRAYEILRCQTNRSCIQYLLVDNIDEFCHIVETRKKVRVQKAEFEQHLKTILTVLDMIGEMDPEDSMLLDRPVTEFKIPDALTALILPQKITLNGDGNRKEMDLRAHVGVDFVLMWAEMDKEKLTYSKFIDSCEYFFGLFKKSVGATKMVSELQLAGAVTPITAKAMTNCNYVMVDGVRPIPAIVTMYDRKYMMIDGRDQLCDMFRNCCDLISKN